MLRAGATRVATRTFGVRASSAIPSSGGESFQNGHVLVTEQEQGNIVQGDSMADHWRVLLQKVQEAAAHADFQSLKKDTRWIHFNETMADLIVRESLEAIQEEREKEMARRLRRDRPAQGCGIDAHAHDCCCGGGVDEVGAPGTDIEPAGQAEQGAQA